MFQPNLGPDRYPNSLLFGWERSDGDFECLASLNGETIDDWRSWNELVEQTYGILTYAMDGGNEIIVLERQDLVEVMEDAGTSPWSESPRVKVYMNDETDDEDEDA